MFSWLERMGKNGYILTMQSLISNGSFDSQRDLSHTSILYYIVLWIITGR